MLPSDTQGGSPAVRANDTLANERTLLAYVRTALAFIAFGFVIARFSLFTREFAALVHGAVAEPELSISFGTVTAIFGVVLAVLGAWRYAATDKGLREGRVATLSTSAAYAASLFVAAIGSIVAFELVLHR
jgi:uncharacterized membrane protein YidH (DUF202 family)